MAPFSHLMPIPGGQHAEQDAIHSYPHYYEPDQLYDIGLDPQETNNLYDDPKYLETLVELKGLMQQYLENLPGDFPL